MTSGAPWSSTSDVAVALIGCTIANVGTNIFRMSSMNPVPPPMIICGIDGKTTAPMIPNPMSSARPPLMSVPTWGIFRPGLEPLAPFGFIEPVRSPAA